MQSWHWKTKQSRCYLEKSGKSGPETGSDNVAQAKAWRTKNLSHLELAFETDSNSLIKIRISKSVIRDLAYKHKRVGYRQIHDFIRKEERVNHKRIYRLYLGLKYRIKRKRRDYLCQRFLSYYQKHLGKVVHGFHVRLTLFGKKIRNIECN